MKLPKILSFLNKNYERKSSRPITSEIASPSKSTAGLNVFVGDVIANPDTILSSESKGKGYDLYQEMLDKDPQIASCVRNRKKAILNKPWEIIPDSEKGRDQRIAKFIKEAFTFSGRREGLFELLDFIPKGFAISEIMWIIKNSEVLIGDLRSRKQNRFVFGKDYELRLKTLDNPWEGEELPGRKFLYLRNEPFAENPYGSAGLKECYWYYWFKKNGIKFWMVLLDKFGSPTFKVQYPAGQLSDDQKRALDEIIDTFQNATGLRVPEGIDLEFLEASRRGDAGYLLLCKYCDQQIAKAIHGQTLTGGEGERVGSMALGRVHEDTKYEYTADDCEVLMDCINSQLIPWLVDYNFADMKKYPRFVIHYEPPEDLHEKVKQHEILFTKIGLPVGKDWLYDTYNVPKPEEDEDLLEIPRGGGMPFANRDKRALLFRAPTGKRYQIVSTLSIQGKFKREIHRILMGMETAYLELIRDNPPLLTVIEEMVNSLFAGEFKTAFNGVTLESITLGAQSMADQIGMRISEEVFQGIMDDYLKYRTYEMGKLEDVASTLRDLLDGKAKALYDQKLSVVDIKGQLKKAFPEMADWKAGQIAKTEVSRAANYAGIQMVKKSGLDMDAWFMTDPASCDICQDWAVSNPYTIRQAEGMGLPHPNCDCPGWVFTLKER